MYLDEHGTEVPCPDDQAGLYIQPRQRIEPVRVQVPTSVNNESTNGCCYALYQIGETSQIQSGGIFQATPHAVMMPRALHTGSASSSASSSASLSASLTASKITRESFAVFMEPEFDTPLSIPHGKTITDCFGEFNNSSTSTSSSSSSSTKNGIVIPSLKGRWKEGQTFGDFHLATVSAFTTTD